MVIKPIDVLTTNQSLNAVKFILFDRLFNIRRMFSRSKKYLSIKSVFALHEGVSRLHLSTKFFLFNPRSKAEENFVRSKRFGPHQQLVKCLSVNFELLIMRVVYTN